MKNEDLTLEEILFLLKSKYESNNLKKIKSLENKIDKMKESYDFELSRRKEISSRWKKAYLELNKNLYNDENIFIIHD